jgi:hypothetical protein
VLYDKISKFHIKNKKYPYRIRVVGVGDLGPESSIYCFLCL